VRAIRDADNAFVYGALDAEERSPFPTDDGYTDPRFYCSCDVGWVGRQCAVNATACGESGGRVAEGRSTCLLSLPPTWTLGCSTQQLVIPFVQEVDWSPHGRMSLSTGAGVFRADREGAGYIHVYASWLTWISGVGPAVEDVYTALVYDPIPAEPVDWEWTPAEWKAYDARQGMGNYSLLHSKGAASPAESAARCSAVGARLLDHDTWKDIASSPALSGAYDRLLHDQRYGFEGIDAAFLCVDVLTRRDAVVGVQGDTDVVSIPRGGRMWPMVVVPHRDLPWGECDYLVPPLCIIDTCATDRPVGNDHGFYV
jgi:hypothetical protein